MWRYILMILVFINTNGVTAQISLNSESDSIIWNPAHKLVWRDFHGKPAPGDNESKKAVCAASIYVESFWDEMINFKVSNSFMKNEAWTLDTLSIKLLEHEQLHFDIAEVYARKIRQAVDSLRKKGVEAVDIYSQVITLLLEQRVKKDELYDTETQHGIFILEQEKWKAKIAKELKVLDKWKALP